MARKKKDLPPKLKDIKTGNDFSFYIRPRKFDIPGESCNYKIQPGLPNLDIVKTKGRKQGEIITYSPDNTYDYLSQSQRYDRSIELVPAYIQEDAENDKTIYGYCSSDSPTGYWEVTIGGDQQATFINFSPPFLTILCPRPFTVSELTTLNSDSSTFQWNQIAGSRTVIITPNNVRDPIIDIQASCFTGTCDANTQLPIIIRVETDNPLLFADLVIFNRPIDFFDGLGYVKKPDQSITCRKVITVSRAPDSLQRAFIWMGENVNITWSNPACDSEFITLYRLQRLIPPYTDQLSFLPSANRLASIMVNQRYRIAADFSVLGSLDTSFSNPITFLYDNTIPLQTIFADDSGIGLGYSYISNTQTTVEFGAQVRNLIDDAYTGLGYAYINNAYATIEIGVQVRDLIDDAHTGLGYALISNDYEKVDLGGVVIG